MDKVLITGATGFIGSHVASEFCNNKIQTGCLVRSGSNMENIKGLPVKIECGDINDFQSLKRIFAGYSFIVHIAGKAGDWGKYDDFYKVNVEGSMNVLKACEVNGIKDIIFTSSISVYGEENSMEVKDENSPHNSHYPYFTHKVFPCGMNYYRDTKRMAKEKSMLHAKEKGLNLTILEPSFVYGEKEFNTGFYEYIKTAATGIPFLPGSYKNKYHVVYVKDLARAYLIAFNKRLEGINSFIIGNEKAQNMEEIYSIFCSKCGIKKPCNIPKVFVYPFGYIIELLCTILNCKKPPLLTRGRVNMFYDNIEYSTQKAREVLGFVNEYGLEEGIDNTVKWYKERNLI